MKAEIHIRRLRLRGRHGVLPQERVVGADFLVSVEALAEVSDEALLHDRLEGTVDYGRIVDILRRDMEVPSCLLEHAAMRMARSLLDGLPQVVRVSLLLEKENPPLGVQSEGIGVKIVLDR